MATWRGTESLVDVAAVADAQHKYDEGAVFDVVDDAVVAHADSEFAVASGELNRARRSRCHREGFDGADDSLLLGGMNFAQGFGGRGLIGDRIGHQASGCAGLQAQFRHEVLVGDAVVLAASGSRGFHVGLILQGL